MAVAMILSSFFFVLLSRLGQFFFFFSESPSVFPLFSLKKHVAFRFSSQRNGYDYIDNMLLLLREQQ